MLIFWINLDIRFKSKMLFHDDNSQNFPENAIGFLHEIGCTADNDEELKTIIDSYLNELVWLNLSDIEVVIDRLGEISPNDISTEIYGDPDIKDSLKGNPRRKGIWYTSGMAFYTDTDKEDFYEVKVQKY